jgi:hypothetical protein
VFWVPDDGHWASAGSHRAFGHTAEQHRSQLAVSMRSHHDQVKVVDIDVLLDLFHGMAVTNVTMEIQA